MTLLLASLTLTMEKSIIKTEEQEVGLAFFAGNEVTGSDPVSPGILGLPNGALSFT